MEYHIVSGMLVLVECGKVKEFVHRTTAYYPKSRRGEEYSWEYIKINAQVLTAYMESAMPRFTPLLTVTGKIAVKSVRRAADDKSGWRICGDVPCYTRRGHVKWLYYAEQLIPVEPCVSYAAWQYAVSKQGAEPLARDAYMSGGADVIVCPVRYRERAERDVIPVMSAAFD